MHIILDCLHMPNLQHLSRRRLPFTLSAVIIFLVLLRLAIAPNGLIQTYALYKKDTATQIIVDSLEAKNDTLKSLIRLAHRDKHWLEDTARAQLGMIKPSETLYQIIPRRSA